LLSQQAAEEPDYVATVEVTCRPGSPLLAKWQIEIWHQLKRAEAANWANYLESAGNSSSAVRTLNPDFIRKAIRQSLRQDITVMLLQRAELLSGESQQVLIGEPWFAQFLDTALEWREMSYSFVPGAKETISNPPVGFSGETLTAFLQAGFARVLLPVHPGRLQSLLYFLKSGMIWEGDDGFTPAEATEVDLLNELKTATREGKIDSRRSAPWRLSVPTPMIVLQESEDLPCFDSYIDTRGTDCDRR
jgi:hypothetical protein